MDVKTQLKQYYGLVASECRNLNTLANDTYAITTKDAKYALKLYNPASRSHQDVAWELELVDHLLNNGVPTANPVYGLNNQQLQSFSIDGKVRPTVLFEWLPGKKTRGNHENYITEGKLAAIIHEAADSFYSNLPREDYNAEILIDEQLSRMKRMLTTVGRWDQVYALGERLKLRLKIPDLDYGVCHMDLTFDNIHLQDDGGMMVFDFDSAGTCWRAYEPYDVLLNSEEYLQSWLKGYRTIRRFSEADENAIYAFAIIGDIRNTTWKLGLANSSRGEPLLKESELAGVVDGWLAQEKLA